MEKILAKKIDKEILYKVKWQNYSLNEASWEPNKNLNYVDESLINFEKKLSRQNFFNLKKQLNNEKLIPYKRIKRKYIKQTNSEKKLLKRKCILAKKLNFEELDFEKKYGFFKKNKPNLIIKHKIYKFCGKDQLMFKIQWKDEAKTGKKFKSNYHSLEEVKKNFKNGLNKYVKEVIIAENESKNQFLSALNE